MTEHATEVAPSDPWEQTRSTARPAPTDLRLRELVTGYRTSQVVYATVKLGLFDLLGARPRTAAELAEAGGADPDTLARFVRALTAERILQSTADGVLSLAPLGERLRSDAPGGLAAWVVTSCEEQFFAWGHAVHTLRTGQSAFEKAHGVGFWEHLRSDAKAAESYDAGMAVSAGEACDLIVSAGGIDRARHVVDVGGGRGTLARRLLDTFPHARVTVLDLPEVVERTRASFAPDPVPERLGLVPGSFLDGVPAGGDVYVLSRVLADWDDAHAARILASCRRAMTPGGRLLIAEGLTRDDAPAGARGLLDLHLLLLFGGRERTVTGLSTLLSGAGFALVSVTGAENGGISLLTAVAR
ncbi:methyltransferase [Streptomyces tirandamycinicus]|uniref:methyltransferase n=1 Tax=Streptomyces tirandamycinicus TaxID=2174846 RepID=UPI00344262FF